jgi:hypothetical protein
MTRLSPKKIACAAVALTLALSMLLTPAPPAGAADHGDAPYVNGDQAVDLADVFMFLDPNDNTKVILAMTLRGFIAAGENINFGQFDPNVRHRFELETTGDARADRFINVTFSKRTAPTAPQTATITLMDGQQFTAPSTPPSTCISGSANCPPAPTITDLGTTGVKFYAGERDDPFNFDIPAFLAFTAAQRICVANPADPSCATPPASNFSRGRDSFAGYNIMTIALSIPRSVFTAAGAGNSIGVVAVTQRRSPTLYPASSDVVRASNTSAGFGRWQTLDRIATPAVNVALIPFARKEEYNSATTQDDFNGRFAADIVATLTALGTNSTNIGILAGIAVTNGDFLRLNLNTPNTTLGFGQEFFSTPNYSGFPNGRRFGDDVVDTELFFIANQPSGGLSDNANQNEQPFLSSFPFVSPPHQPQPAGVTDDRTRN